MSVSKLKTALGLPNNGTLGASQNEEKKIVVSDFPYTVFHPKLQSIINDCYKYLSYPKNFTAGSILAATSFAVGRKMRVQYLWDEGSVLYMVIVAPPGTCKSHPLSFAMQPLKKNDAKQFQEYQQEVQQSTEDGEKSRTALKKTVHGDFTIESLGSYLNNNRRGVGVYTDELRGFFKNFERYSGGSQQEFWLENWSSGTLNVSRQGRTIYIDKPNIPIVGTTQPSVLDEMGKDGRSVNGFIERFLYIIDEDVPVLKLKRRADRSTTEYSHLMGRYLPIMQNIYDIPSPEPAGDDERKEWHTIYFEEQADDVMTDYINALKAKMEGIENEYIRNIYSKMQSYALRFALLIEVLDWACENNDFSLPQDLQITTDSVGKAIMLSDYFLQMALKANSLINFASPIDKMPKDFRIFYRALPDEFSFGEGEKIAAQHGFPRPTYSRYLKKPELFQKLRGGKNSGYEKVAF